MVTLMPVEPYGRWKKLMNVCLFYIILLMLLNV